MDSGENKTVYMMPTMGLAHFGLLKQNLEGANWTVIFSTKFPKRGIFFGRKFDVMHLHMLDHIFKRSGKLREIGVIVAFMALYLPFLKLRRIRLVWTCHEIAAHEGDSEGIAIAMAKTMARWSDRIVVQNVALAQRLVRELPQSSPKITLLPLGDLSPFYDPIGGNFSMEWFPDEPVILSAGFMRRNKGNDVILRSFRRLENKSARLRMVGNCNDIKYKKELELIAKDDPRVTLEFGSLTDEQIVSEHVKSSVVVFAFRDCPTSASVITAMSLSRAVIGPSLGHLPELIDERSGWLFSPDAPEDGLLLAMMAAIEDQQASKEKGRAARARINQDDWQTITQSLIEVYSMP